MTLDGPQFAVLLFRSNFHELVFQLKKFAYKFSNVVFLLLLSFMQSAANETVF